MRKVMVVQGGKAKDWIELTTNGASAPKTLTPEEMQGLNTHLLQPEFNVPEVITIGAKFIGEDAAKALLAKIVAENNGIRNAIKENTVMSPTLARELLTKFMEAVAAIVESKTINPVANGHVPRSNGESFVKR